MQPKPQEDKMKKLAILVLSLALMMSIATPVSAVNPGPPSLPGPYANFLSAIAGDIGGVGMSLDSLLEVSPGPPEDPAAVRAALNDIIVGAEGILAAVNGYIPTEIPPDPEDALAIAQALLNVKIGAEVIIVQCDAL